MASKRKRLDILLTDRGFYSSRERAKAAIMAGLVMVNGKKIDKAGTGIDEHANIIVEKDPMPFVGRGGLKLERALEFFKIDVTGNKAVDIGASTGGFTDCLLKRGAQKVYAVDVGYGQLAWKLRRDPRVVIMERTNIRYVNFEDIGELCDIITIDVSFISLELVLPVAKSLLKPEGKIVALIKPQFEAGREKVGRKGIIKEPSVHREVVLKVYDFITDIGLRVKGITHSPITGAGGNIEYFIYASGEREPENEEIPVRDKIDEIIKISHSVLA